MANILKIDFKNKSVAESQSINRLKALRAWLLLNWTQKICVLSPG